MSSTAIDVQNKVKSGSAWVRTMTSPFRKARTRVLNPSNKDKKTKQGCESCDDGHAMSLHGEVMACTYEDVRVMWSILDKSGSHVSNSS